MGKMEDYGERISKKTVKMLKKKRKQRRKNLVKRKENEENEVKNMDGKKKIIG